MTISNTQWTLASRPTEMVAAENFMLRETTLDIDDLKPGEIVVKNIYALCAPSQRNWMREPTENGHPMIGVGDVIRGPVASQVVRSAHPDYPVGRFGFSLSGWQIYDRLDLNGGDFIDLYPADLDPMEGLGVYGINSCTAYIGVTEFGRPVRGETMLVSGAAGSAGSAAAQIGKLLGCRVVGLAGSDEKCRWLVDVCGIDAAINYRSEALDARLAELFPGGIDIFFDNVGADILSTAFNHMAVKGRVVMCGQIAGYNHFQPVLTTEHLNRAVYRSIGIHGYNLNHFLPKMGEAISALRGWVAEGRFHHREDLRDGFEALPHTYPELFTGDNKGTLIVKMAEPDAL